MSTLQDKQKEIDFFDAHAESDGWDVFTPEANARLIAAFVRLSRLPRGARVADLELWLRGIHRAVAARRLCECRT